ncbi:MAG: ATP-binding domain-containing protein, partial [Deltaproteobacteria bacterium]|nr:ATP-binding domain-containing protein [Deltaproteobacteria bacterium]
ASGKGAGVGKASGKGAGVGKDGGGECVVLSTIHSAKGLEWPHVFILSAVEGRLPFYLSQNDDDLLEEERRLMYVAVTRAKDSLLVSSPRWVMAGDIEPERARPSRFLSAPPKRKAASGSSRARRAVSARKR